MGSVVLSTLSIFLGLFFLFVGTLKVSPDINREMHRDIKKSFAQYAKVFPLARTLGFKVPSKWLRLIVGWSEVLSGTTLVFIPGAGKQVANVILLILTGGACYFHAILEDRIERTAPSIVFSLMLACRLVVWYQVYRRQVAAAAAAKKD